MSTLGNRIRIRRLQLQLTQEQLAFELGYKSKSSINKIENGENDLPQHKIKSFANALNTTTAYLIGWVSSPDDRTNEYNTSTSSDNLANPDADIYGDHQANLEYFRDKPDLLQVYKEIWNSESLKLLFDSARDLSPKDLETVLLIVNAIKRERMGQ